MFGWRYMYSWVINPGSKVQVRAFLAQEKLPFMSCGPFARQCWHQSLGNENWSWTYKVYLAWNKSCIKFFLHTLFLRNKAQINKNSKYRYYGTMFLMSRQVCLSNVALDPAKKWKRAQKLCSKRSFFMKPSNTEVLYWECFHLSYCWCYWFWLSARVYAKEAICRASSWFNYWGRSPGLLQQVWWSNWRLHSKTYAWHFICYIRFRRSR